MVNVDNPHGLRPLMRMGGGDWAVEEFDKVVGYGSALYFGDAVNRVATGVLEKSATPGSTAYSGVNLTWGAVSTATKHQVIVDPNMIYEAQDNGTTGILAANIGLNANLELNAGSATTLLSGHEINEAGIAVTASLDVKMLRLHNVPNNDFGPHARIEIMFNKHRLAMGVVGV